MAGGRAAKAALSFTRTNISVSFFVRIVKLICFVDCWNFFVLLFYVFVYVKQVYKNE